jgi:hypothetical protein
MPVMPSPYDALRVWHLLNVDTGEHMRGQFHAEGLTHGGVGGEYSQKWSLNRAHPIVQFVHGKSETYSFTGRFHATTSAEEAETQLETLKLWARREDAFERPPVLEFWAGNGHAFFTRCVLESLDGITYSRPTALGSVRGVTFTVNLLQYKEYSLEGPVIGDTRYHRARQGDYFELVAVREYGDAKYGDVIRKRHAATVQPQIGDVIKLPHISKIRRERVEPKSLPLFEAFSRKDKPARALRLAVLDRHSGDHVSHVLRA